MNGANTLLHLNQMSQHWIPMSMLDAKELLLVHENKIQDSNHQNKTVLSETFIEEVSQHFNIHGLETDWLRARKQIIKQEMKQKETTNKT